MKLLHTSDWHIGHTLYAKKRYKEHEKFLCWLKQTIEQRQIDALIVAGDVFDTGLPGGQAQKLYYGFLTSLLGTCCKTVIIVAGNHDSPALLEAPAGVLEHLCIHAIGLPSAPEHHVIPLLDASGKVGALCCAVPYLRKNEMVRLTDEAQTSDERIVAETASFYQQVTQKAVDMRAQYGPVPIVATGHLFAAGAKRSEGDSVRELYVGSLGQVGAEIFPQALDYVALGHIHGTQKVAGNEHIQYCGAPLPMSFAEAEREKYVIEVDLDKALKTQKIAVPVFQQLMTLSGERDDILTGLEALADKDVWIEVQYTGKAPCAHLASDVYETIKGALAQVLSVRNTAAAQRMLSQSTESESLESLSVQEVFLRCIDEDAYSKEERQALIDCFDEVVRALEEEETCA